jgi:hypothetical protein
MVLRGLFLGEPFTLLDFGADEITVLRREHEKALRVHGEHVVTCANCAGNLHPVRYERGPDVLDILGHDPGHGHRCAVARGESAHHDRLKWLIAGAAGRVAGWRADVEVRGDGIDPATGFPPVVDVVARREQPAPFEKPHGWEAQVSPASDASILNRQEVRELFLARCDWISHGRPAWRHQVPWLGIGDDEPGTVHVVAGVVVRVEDGYAGDDYAPAEPEPLSRVVADILRPGPRQLRWVEGLYRPDGGGGPVGAFYRPAAPRGRVAGERPPVAVVRPSSRPAMLCQRDPVAPPAVPDRPVRPPAPQPGLWREIPNRPAGPAISEDEYREAMAAAYAEYRAGPHAGPPAGWTPEAAEARIRDQARAAQARYLADERRREADRDQ